MTRSCFQAWPRPQQEAFLATLTEAEKAVLLYDWLFWARDKQLPPPEPWSVWLILSGRGFGKTRMGAQWIKARAECGLYERFALIGQTAADVRDVMIEGDSGILKCSPPWFSPKYEPSKRRLTWPNGATATTFSGDEPDQLRGPQFDSVWADEPAKWKYAEAAWNNMEFGLRLGENPQVVATTTPRPIPLIRSLLADERTDANPHGQVVVTRGHTDENRSNLSDVFVKRVVKKYEGTRLGRQELGGELLDDNPSALWKRAQIDALRVPTAPLNLARIAVGVDPAVADVTKLAKLAKAGLDADDNTAETGIVVAGITAGPDPHGYVLDDKSLRDTPNGWGGAVVDAYKLWSADKIVAEVNNGGALVEFVLSTVAKDQKVSISYQAVHASRGKLIRADPVAALYEQSKVHHVGTFPVLEDQMCDWEPGMPSPDHMDALVWALTFLFKLEQQDAEKTIGLDPLEFMTSTNRSGPPRPASSTGSTVSLF